MLVEIYKKMFQVLIPSNLKEFCKGKEGTLKKGIFAYFLAWVVSSLVIIFAMHLDFMIHTWTPSDMDIQYQNALWAMASIPISILFAYLSLYLLNWFTIRVFKTKERFVQLFYVNMLISAGSLLLWSLGSLVGVINMLISNILIGLIFIYSIILFYLSVKWIYKLSLWHTIVSIMGASLMFALIFIGLVLAIVLLLVGLVQFGFILAIVLLILLVVAFILKRPSNKK